MKLRDIIGLALVSVVLTPALTACQGRTTDNVQPNGETAEVIIDTPVTEVIISDGNPDSTQTVNLPGETMQQTTTQQ